MKIYLIEFDQYPSGYGEIYKAYATLELAEEAQDEISKDTFIFELELIHEKS